MKTELKVGDRVRVKNSSLLNFNRIARIIKLGRWTGVEFQNGERIEVACENLELLEPSLDCLFVGDVVVRDYTKREAGKIYIANEDETEILGICGKLALGHFMLGSGKFVSMLTVDCLKELGYALKGSEGDGTRNPFKICRHPSYNFISGECNICSHQEKMCIRGTVNCEDLHSNCEALQENLEPCSSLKCETIKIGGKKYNEQEVIERCKSLKEHE